MITQIVLTSTDSQDVINITEYDNFRDAEVVLELNEDDYHYYANITNIKVFYPQADLLINSTKGWIVDIFINSLVLTGYLTFDDIQIVHDDYVILNIQVNTHNKILLDLYSSVLVDGGDVNSSTPSEKFLSKTYVDFNTAGSYPRSSLFNFLVSMFQFMYNDIESIAKTGFEDFSEAVNTFTFLTFLNKKTYRIILHIIKDTVFVTKMYALFRLIRDLTRNIFQVYNFIYLKDAVREFLQMNQIEYDNLDFIDNDYIIVTRNNYILAKDVFEFIKKYYNVYINIYEEGLKKKIRFIKPTQNINFVKSYQKIKKRDSYMLKNVLLVRFNRDFTNHFSIINLFTDAVGTVVSDYVKSTYEKIIESASKSVDINLNYNLYSRKIKNDLLDYLIFFILSLFPVIIILGTIAIIFATSGANFFHVSYLSALMFIALGVVTFMTQNYKVKKNVIRVSNISSQNIIAKVESIKNVRLFAERVFQITVKDSFEVLQKVKNSYSETYFRYIYQERAHYSWDEFLNLLQNPANVKSVRYRVFDELLEGEFYENVLATNINVTERFV